MIEQLKEMLVMQRRLDEAIHKEKGIFHDPDDKLQIALFVELGELMNELPTTFKYWKSSAKDNRNKALVEYVDALHFSLSLANRLGPIFRDDLERGKEGFDYNSRFIANLSQLSLQKLLYATVENEFTRLSFLFALGRKLGFTWGEIYTVYRLKNAENWERLYNGY